MAKNKKQKRKPSHKGATVTKRNTAAAARESDISELEPDDTESDADGETPEKPEYGPVDEARAKQLFEEMFEQEKEIRAAERKVDAARDELSRIVNEAKEAMGGASGPFVLNGERVQLRTRGTTSYFTVEETKNLHSFDLGVERAARGPVPAREAAE